MVSRSCYVETRKLDALADVCEVVRAHLRP